MANAAHQATGARHRVVKVLENVPLARDVRRVRFECPEMAAAILPGQFLMMRLTGLNDPLLGRALALYDTIVSDAGEPWGIDVVYLTKGKFTTRLAAATIGTSLDVWGPLGNGFGEQETEHLILVAGGIGQTPMLALAQERLGLRSYGQPPRSAGRASRVTLCFGARRADMLACVEDFEQSGVRVRLATEDGERGHRGLVTEVLEDVLAEDQTPRRIVCCGPEKMMAVVAAVARRTETPCQVSLETPMACGIGICFSCVAKVRDASGSWDYRRTCLEGPVFDAQQIEWS